MGRKSLKDTRQKEIIRMFYRVAKKEGLENTSIAKIAAVMDINPSLIMHYFQTRDDLISGLIDFMLDKYQLLFGITSKTPDKPEVVLLKVIDRLFSKEWNQLFDDGLFYSCYSLTFRNAQIREKYKTLLDSLRQKLAALIQDCADAGTLHTPDAYQTADLIFILVDGAYYYLSLVNDKKEYGQKLDHYKQQALQLLQLSKTLTGPVVAVSRPEPDQQPGYIDDNTLPVVGVQ
ncbi:TetR family transcriptional regulator [Larkinella arboricola]|uniref:Biofilm operon icaADBC HTH-type negative transcriptional regulator IcaR n=1 Tax=Larkinella arboricola TaxID=643671 RepID=A0A327X9J6_LARAB|nr:TetR family transcriptional regulator [Larkinella arboricola]RAK02928.1 TetR family transcriptional regulator [Larkinella arboricola]